MEISVSSRPRQQGPWPEPGEFKTAGLVQSRQQVHTPLMGLQEQQSAVLSVFADKHRHTAQKLTLQGPLVGYRVVQTLSSGVWPKVQELYLCGSPQLAADSMSLLNGSLPKMVNAEITHCHSAALELLDAGTAWLRIDSVNLAHNQLDANALSLLPQANWTHLRSLRLDHNMIGVSGMQHLVACSWPVLQCLSLENVDIDELALHCLAEGQWPVLQFLDLSENNMCAQGIYT